MLLGQAVGGLFLDPGLGKTSISLATFKILKQQGYVRSALIVAPLRPIYKVWPDEIEKWQEFGELSYTILHGPNKHQNLKLDCDLYLINPEGLIWLLSERKELPVPWDVLIIDESTRFKDATTKRFKLLKPHVGNFKRRWILTGTPVPNGLSDLFGQIYILDLGRSLGKYITHFRSQFYVRAGYNLYEWIPREGAFSEVVEKVKPLIFQLSAEDYLKMPAIVERYVEVTLPKEAMKIYQEVEEEFISVLASSTLVAANAAVAGVKCRQIANGAVYDEARNVLHIHDEKVEALESILEELGPTPTLICYEFTHDRDRILSKFPEIPVLGSGLSPQKLSSLIDGFNRGNVPRLLGHPASMGHGLNLQGSCHHIVWFCITWNLEHYDQAIARIYRQGQKSDRVFVYHIVAKGTRDERVVKVLTAKDHDQQALLKALGTR